MNKISTKNILLIATYIIVLIAIALNIQAVAGVIGKGLSILQPVWMAIAIAFILNIPMSFFEKLLTPKEKKINGKIVKKKELKHKRTFAILITIVVVILVIALLLTFIIPQLVQSITTLVSNMPGYLQTLQEYALNLKVQFSIPDDIVNSTIEYFTQIFSNMTTSISSLIPEAFKMTQGILGGIINFFIAIILAIYMLASKEKLCKNVKRVIIAFLPKKGSDYLLKVGSTLNMTFKSFITGQVTEAMILGILCYIGMLVFRIEYAALISVIIAFTALIPYFGGFIGSIPSAFILCMISPMKALGFLVYIFILQQIEGNLIYPRVVGNSIGISGIWILIAIVIGTSLGGVMGILIGIPIFATIYILLREAVNIRLKDNDIPESMNKTEPEKIKNGEKI